ncbi:MAG: type III secretion system export apparatus subunit SctS [Puniceicoccales bacterium]|jgi:type III secretion HrpO family protein|nr:type III secretion system export apparatus subunit SctS [Puniceicoccales bacterium]MDR1233421.1 type III secretion system export apparatus subunit SctS [Puniceicoccales bacterium]
MHESFILSVTSKAMILVLVLSMPPILIATTVGLLISLLQALTQVQEQTLGFAVKLIFVIVVLALTTHWIGGEILEFTTYLFDEFPVLAQ